jgi:hypothetical protein
MPSATLEGKLPGGLIYHHYHAGRCQGHDHNAAAGCDEGVASLIDVHLHAGTGLSGVQLPAIDYALLLRSVGQENVAATKASAVRRRPASVRQPARRARGVTPAVAEPAKRTRARIAAKKTTRRAGSDARAYRRMPKDLAGVYKRIGGTTAVAEHYAVPRHTVQGWLRRLRAEGVISSA